MGISLAHPLFPGRIGIWKILMLVFVEGGKLEYSEKCFQGTDENQQQTQPTYEFNSRNQTQVTLVGGEQVLPTLCRPCSPVIRNVPGYTIHFTSQDYLHTI